MFTLAAAFDAIDNINALDPNSESVEGEPIAKSLIYGQRMSRCLAAFKPQASDALAIAARAQHIERWVIPRSDYPMNRAGYHSWRTELGLHHARRTQTLLTGLGADTQLIEAVGRLLRKEDLKHNPDTQTLEDVACLVFIQFYLDAFSQQHDEPKLIRIIQKTWRKMSDGGRAAALTIPLNPALQLLINKALGAP